MTMESVSSTSGTKPSGIGAVVDGAVLGAVVVGAVLDGVVVGGSVVGDVAAESAMVSVASTMFTRRSSSESLGVSHHR